MMEEENYQEHEANSAEEDEEKATTHVYSVEMFSSKSKQNHPGQC